MRKWKERIARDTGWTFIEATLAIVIMAIMVLGMTIVLMAFREQLDRSWAVRVMDQYGNDVIEEISHDLRNATEVTSTNGPANTSRVDLKFLDPIRHDNFLYSHYRVNQRIGRIEKDGQPMDPGFPPTRLGRGETYEILQFTLTPYGTTIRSPGNYPQNSPPGWEHRDAFGRDKAFMNAAWDLRLTLRYTRQAINPGDPHWSQAKVYFNRVYVRNMNLIVQQGITD